MQVDDGIDTGSVLCQGVFDSANEHGFYWRFLGHLALLDGLADMKASLDALFENEGRFVPVSQSGRVSNNYTWIRMTEYVAIRLRAMLRAKA